MTATKRLARTALLIAALTLVAAVVLQGSRAQQEPERQPSDRASLTVTVEPAEALVGVAGPNGYLTFYPADGAGEQALSDLEPGTYIVVATAEGYASERVQIELAPGERVGTTLTLQALGDGAGGGQNGQTAGQNGHDGQTGQTGNGGDGGGDGEEVFSQNCAQCHGAQGGGGSGPALAGNQTLQDAQAVLRQIREGGGGMPSFSGQLSEEQITAVASFIRTSWGNDFGTVEGDGRQNQDQQNQQGQQTQNPNQQNPNQQNQDGAGGPEAQQPEVEVQQEEGGVRIEITLRQGDGAPVTIDLRIGLDAEAGGATVQEGQANQQPGQNQQAQNQQPQNQQTQTGQQDQPTQDQPTQDQPTQDQPAQDRSEQAQQGSQSCRQSGEGVEDPELLGTLEIAWVDPAGTLVTVTGPEGCREELQIIGGAVLTDLAPGGYVVTATRPGFESVSTEVEVGARQSASVTLALHPQEGQQVQTGPDPAAAPGTAEQNGQTGQSGGGGDGEGVFSRNCAQCHGAQGGGGSGPALAGNQTLQDAQAVLGQIREGGGGMPSFSGQLSEEQITAVASFIRTSWGNDFGAVEGDGQQNQQDRAQQDRAGARSGGWFSQAQAQSGFEEYERHCAVCHGSGLEGRAGYPGLVGDEFLAAWQGRTVEALYEYISTEMPQDRPGTLGHPTYTDITAYILAQNGFPAGQELDTESARAEGMILTAPGGTDAGGEGQAPADPPGP